MDGDELKHQGIQWLRDGGEIEAHAILERCELVERYVAWRWYCLDECTAWSI